MKEAIGYIRVSTEQQTDEGVSLEAQKAKIAVWCQTNDYELVHIYVDAGISGKSIDKRTGLQAALSAAKKDSALVVYSLSRLARSTKDCISIGERLKKKGCDLVSITEKIDTGSAMGEFFFTLMAALGQMERKLIAERTAMALKHKKDNGEVYAPVPFGYSAIDGRLVELEAEANIVAEIMRKRATGSTLTEIATDLNNAGIAGKKGGRWFASSVRYLINRQEAKRADA
jgi:site-specific DNA recombinase